MCWPRGLGALPDHYKRCEHMALCLCPIEPIAVLLFASQNVGRCCFNRINEL